MLDDDVLGLLHVGARWYDPAIGRFISRDPIGIAGGLNVYVYCANSPLGCVDPTGLVDGGITGQAVSAGIRGMMANGVAVELRVIGVATESLGIVRSVTSTGEVVRIVTTSNRLLLLETEAIYEVQWIGHICKILIPL